MGKALSDQSLEEARGPVDNLLSRGADFLAGGTNVLVYENPPAMYGREGVLGINVVLKGSIQLGELVSDSWRRLGLVQEMVPEGR